MKVPKEDLSLNPSVRVARKIYVSMILRCPQAKSKISLHKCRECPHFAGEEDYNHSHYVACTYRKETGDKFGNNNR